MKNANIFGKILFGIGLLLLLGLDSAFARWQTTWFEIVVADPSQYGRAFETMESNVLRLALNEDELFSMELFLHDVAVHFENKGFADPVAAGVLGPLVDENNGDKKLIRVYLLDIMSFNTAYTAANVPLAYYTNDCDGPEFPDSIFIHKPNAFKNNRVKDETYATLAHELFHAVQKASLFGRSRDCSVGKWITEGTADAIGYDMGRLLRGLEYSESNVMIGRYPPFLKVWGGRRYYAGLQWANPSVSDDYLTSSLWRHLAEWNLGNKHQGSAPAKFDYGYLAKLFATPMRGTGNASGLRWLNSWMKSSGAFGTGLAPIYAQFTSALADHMATRIPRITNLTPESSREERWFKKLFEQCQNVTLSDTIPKDSLTIDINDNAARCFSVTVDGDSYTPKVVWIDNSNLKLEEQNQLYIGSIGGQLVSQGNPWIAESPSMDAGKSFAKWEFLVLPGVPNYFVVSNMATDPATSVPVDPEFHFSVPDWTSSLTTKSEPPPGSSTAGQPKTRKAVNDYNKFLRKNPTTQSATAAMSGSDPNPPDSGCSSRDMARNLCGPRLAIKLSKDFGMIPGNGPIAAYGGTINQIGGLQAQSLIPQAAGDAASLEQFKTMEKNNKGNSISIAIPVIPYGSSSTTVAMIEVSSNSVDSGNGKIADSLVSIRRNPDGDGVYPPNGTVNITEYTPHILQGNFTARLVSNAEVRKAGVSRDQPTLPAATGVSGTFVVSGPWRGNGARPDVSKDSAMMTGLRNDMMEMLMIMPANMRQSIGRAQFEELCQLGFEDQQLSSLGIEGGCGGSGGSVLEMPPACNCDCNAWERVATTPECGVECDSRWRLWQCGPYLETGIGELDAETQRYRDELQALGLEENEMTPMTYGFKISSPEIRAAIWEELEQTRSQRAQQDLSAEIAEIEAEQTQRGSNYDAETLRYKTALEQAGYAPAEVDGLVEIFSPSPEIVRKVYWDEVAGRAQDQ